MSSSASGRFSVLDRLFTPQELGDIAREDEELDSAEFQVGKRLGRPYEVPQDIHDEKAFPNEPQGVPVERIFENKAMDELREKSQASDTTKRLVDRTSMPHIFGRDVELKRLATLIHKSSSATAVAVVHGAAGCGVS